MVARTGYTGEDGFELACRNDDAVAAVDRARRAATPLGGLPIGLGARDTLRLESQAAALRQRSRRRSHAARGGPRLGGQARRPRLHRRRRAARAEGARADAPAGRLHDRRRRARDRAPRLPVVDRAPSDRRRSASSPAAARASRSAARSASPTSRSALATAGTQLTIDCRGKDDPRDRGLRQVLQAEVTP